MGKGIKPASMKSCMKLKVPLTRTNPWPSEAKDVQRTVVALALGTSIRHVWAARPRCRSHGPVQQIKYKKQEHSCLVWFYAALLWAPSCPKSRWQRQERACGWIRPPDLPEEPAPLLPCSLISPFCVLSLRPRASTPSWPLTLRAAQPTPPARQGTRQSSVPPNSPVLQSLMSPRVLAFSISSSYAKGGFLDMESWTLQNPLLLTYTQIHMPQEVGKRGFAGFLLFWWKVALSGISGSSSTLLCISVLSFWPAHR